MNITIGITPGAAATAEQIAAFGDGVLPAAGKGLARGLQLAASVAQTRYLSGPRPQKLGLRTGRLRGSIVTKVTVNQNSVRGAIGTNVPYGAFHEYGFRGTESVRAHRRTIGVFFRGGKVDLHERRRAVYDQKGGFVRYRVSVRDAAAAVAAAVPRTHLQVVDVKAHARTLNYAGRPFIRPALKDTEPQMLEAIRAEVGKLVTGPS